MKAQALREFSKRLAKNWRELADYFEILSPERSAFEQGREPIEVIKWLERRERTGELATALEIINREDLLEIATELIADETPQQASIDLKTKVRMAPVTLDLTTWADSVRKIGGVRLGDDEKIHLVDRLLHKKGFEKKDERRFESLEAFLDSIAGTGVVVELHTGRAIEQINNAEEFWIRIIATLIADVKDPSGPWLWLIRESGGELSNTPNSKTRISKVWSYILDSYFNAASVEYRPDALVNLVEAVIEETTEISSPSKKSGLLFVVVSFLHKKLGHDTKAIKEINRLLTDYHDALGNNENPKFLEVLETLIGIGLNLAVRKLDDLPAFMPRMAPIKFRKWFDYEFEAMIDPLTVLEIAFLKGVLPPTAGENPKYPYLFKAVSDEGKEIYNLFSAEIGSILNLASEYEPDDRFEWDIPTVCEWIALAGCDDQPYPWGTKEVSPALANFDFGKKPKLRPVGAHPAGASRFGIQDCFGNVHEVVRVSESANVPRDFRLAGGCYQTNAHLATPGFIRKFKMKEPEVRRNIGLRLVRYKQQDRKKRFRALEEYHAARATTN